MRTLCAFRCLISHLKTVIGRRTGKVASALLIVLVVLPGCAKHGVPVIKESALGTLHVDVQGTSAEGEFRIPNDATNSNLGFEIHGLSQDNRDVYVAQWQHVLHELASGKLRLRLQLFSKNSTNEFYCAEFPLGLAGAGAEYGADRAGANYMDSGNRERPQPLCFFTGIKPIGSYSDFDLLGDVTVTYRFQRNVLPVKRGRLISGMNYKLKVTVLNPVAITNQFQLLLYSVWPPSNS